MTTATHVPSANSSSVKWVSQLTVHLTELGATGPYDLGTATQLYLHSSLVLPRDAVLAVVVCPSVSVCLSVTRSYCIKTAKPRITQATTHDSTGTL